MCSGEFYYLFANLSHSPCLQIYAYNKSLQYVIGGGGSQGLCAQKSTHSRNSFLLYLDFFLNFDIEFLKVQNFKALTAKIYRVPI
jgi:hypothetical protein